MLFCPKLSRTSRLIIKSCHTMVSYHPSEPTEIKPKKKRPSIQIHFVCLIDNILQSPRLPRENPFIQTNSH